MVALRTLRFMLLLDLLYCVGSTAQELRPSINDLRWISGCWAGKWGTRVFNEQWMTPSGGTMMGMSRSVEGDSTREYEFLQLRQKADGSVYYVALPSGQRETWFKLVRLAGREAVFENPDHDFPQRIIYRMESDTSLVARIEGTSKGKIRGIDFPMKRVRCD